MACQSVRWFVAAAVILATGTVCPTTQAGDDKPNRRDRFEAIKADYDKWGSVVKEASIKAE